MRDKENIIRNIQQQIQGIGYQVKLHQRVSLQNSKKWVMIDLVIYQGGRAIFLIDVREKWMRVDPMTRQFSKMLKTGIPFAHCLGWNQIPKTIRKFRRTYKQKRNESQQTTE